MDINLTIVQLAFIFFPGVIWASIHRRFNVRAAQTSFDFLVNCFVFGVIAYFVIFGLYPIFDQTHPIARFFSIPEAIPTNILSIWDLVIAAAVALVLGTAWTALETHKVVARFL